MKSCVVNAIAMPLLVASLSAVGASPGTEEEFGFDQARMLDNHHQPLDVVQMETLRGGLAPLGIALGIAGLDLALMGFYWGVYVPYYAPQEPAYDLP
jgi:hypothetical protein